MKSWSTCSWRWGRHLRDADHAKSAAYFRSALLLESSHQKALFGYACACREWYLSLDAETHAAQMQAFKDESTEFFEWCQTLYPEFGAAYYFLGYAYLNLGLYTKAKLTWDRFLALTPEEEERQEIEDRLDQVEGPGPDRRRDQPAPERKAPGRTGDPGNLCPQRVPELVAAALLSGLGLPGSGLRGRSHRGLPQSTGTVPLSHRQHPPTGGIIRFEG